MKIIYDNNLKLNKGDFAAACGTELKLPLQLKDLLEKKNIHTAEVFLSFLKMTPKQIADELQWTEQEVNEAKLLLVSGLQGKIAPGILDSVKKSVPFQFIK